VTVVSGSAPTYRKRIETKTIIPPTNKRTESHKTTDQDRK
jgi:hypothetical protein